MPLSIGQSFENSGMARAIELVIMPYGDQSSSKFNTEVIMEM